MERKQIKADLLIIGGGTAGCFAALTAFKQNPELNIVIAEKANVERSGCLAAGVNALNAYIIKGKTPQFYADYAQKDVGGIARSDLLLSMSERLNKVTKDMEKLGLVILKDENGEYVTRGNRNIKINGENFKPLLAKAVRKTRKISVYNQVNMTDFLVENGTIYGALGIAVDEEVQYIFEAPAVIVATGGAAGLYKPNNPGQSRHKMWYPPFNTGAGYAMGILSGAEMTTFEMRFIALRCKDTIAPTGTIAQGVGAKQINSLGEVYEDKYGLTTSERVYGTVRENIEGRGPCYLKTTGISEEADQDLLKAYLNMAPSQTLKWIESGYGPSEQDVEIEGTEPYIVGGHTASGYWIDNKRATTIRGLYAAGDVAGGAPQKYVTGALAEGEIAAENAVSYLTTLKEKVNVDFTDMIKLKTEEIVQFLVNPDYLYTIDNLEEAMQKVMDEYAGGISTNYEYNTKQLILAQQKIKQLQGLVPKLAAKDMNDIVHIYELKERLVVCLSVIAHLNARKETRWHAFAENLDYPEKSVDFEKYVNSIYENGAISVFTRELVKTGDEYEHQN